MAQQVARHRLGVGRDVERPRPRATPAYGQPVMLRTELPQASRVVRPASAMRRIAVSTSCSLHEVELHVLARRDVAEAARVAARRRRRGRELGRVEDALRDLDPEHLHVVAGAGRRCRAPAGRPATGPESSSPRSNLSSVAANSSISASFANESRVRPRVFGSSSAAMLAPCVACSVCYVAACLLLFAVCCSCSLLT